jgi:hypothetical protein
VGYNQSYSVWNNQLGKEDFSPKAWEGGKEGGPLRGPVSYTYLAWRTLQVYVPLFNVLHVSKIFDTYNTYNT